jgi:hypothetical protein
LDIRYKPTAMSLDLEKDAVSIDDLNVSEKWKERFRLIEKAGPFERGKYRHQETLTPAERRKINFNVPAFLFSAFYYLVKGMPRKAFVIAGCGWLFAALLTILESILNFTAPSSIFWIVPGAVVASLANRDYYQKMVLHEDMWASLSVLESWIAATAFAVVSFGVLFAAIWWTLPGG